MYADGPDIQQERTDALIIACRRGDPGADDRLCTLLRPAVARAVAFFLSDDASDLDDVVQESLLAALGYLHRDEAFSGDFVRLTVTIANNRCRDILRARRRRPQVQIDALAEWIADETRSPLDDLQDGEMHALLQLALDDLGRECRELLRALYLEELSAEEVRKRIGLGTVQGVYYRKALCLEGARKILNRRLSIRSIPGSRTGHPTQLRPLKGER